MRTLLLWFYRFKLRLVLHETIDVQDDVSAALEEGDGPRAAALMAFGEELDAEREQLIERIDSLSLPNPRKATA